jgi:endonuclease/exonuclease/phosphatase family metal-dependent hydrolase
MIKVMSFNLRYSTADDGENRWERRRRLVVDRIRVFNPDLLGVQECRDDLQAEYLKSSLPEYRFIGVRRGGDGESAVEMTPILYKQSTFDEIEKGHFWLSETPDISGSKSWGSLFPRTVTWVKLRDKKSGRSVVFLNTHFDHKSETALTQSAGLLRKWAQKSAQKHPVILVGDFNADKNTTAYSQLACSGLLYDVYRRAHPDGDKEETYHGYGKSGVQSPIDWILASEHLETVGAEIDRYGERGLYPSDHFPLTAVLRLRNL